MKKYRIIYLVISVFLLFHSSAFSESAREIQRLKNAVVKIHTTSAAPDYFTPWRLMNPKQGSGSGSVISGNRILTNAHVVADARYIQVQKNADPKKYLAKLTFVSHEADLAILEVVDQSFFKGLKALPIGDLPEPLQEVSVYGYPFGGSALSITRGILSRVEHHYYSHGSSYLLAGQIDAAINPGNSGGPVIVDNQIAGVVMQGIPGGENLGYFVPPSVIKHVLKDAEDGRHDGMPDLGFRTQDLESPAMKASLKLDEDQSGILIAKIFEESPAFGKLQHNDVLLAIDGYEIADDNSIEVRKDLRTNYKYAIDQFHVGDDVELTISRDGESQKITVTAGERLPSYNLVINEAFDELPKYYVYGGIVFVPLNMNLIKRWGRDWRNKAPTEFLYARNRWTSPDQREIVVALKVLPTDVNLGYHSWSNWIVNSVNGTAFKDFQEFTQLVHTADSQYVTFGDEDGFRMVINNEEAKSSQAKTLELYQIPSPYSPGLFDQ